MTSFYSVTENVTLLGPSGDSASSEDERHVHPSWSRVHILHMSKRMLSPDAPDINIKVFNSTITYQLELPAVPFEAGFTTGSRGSVNGVRSCYCVLFGHISVE
ncbi:hypothetical protein ACROYT_G023990 [Oculina patagonica]